jgi:hypothetical protein
VVVQRILWKGREITRQAVAQTLPDGRKRVVVSPAFAKELPPAALEWVVQHEIAHLLYGHAAYGSLPQGESWKYRRNEQVADAYATRALVALGLDSRIDEVYKTVLRYPDHRGEGVHPPLKERIAMVQAVLHEVRQTLPPGDPEADRLIEVKEAAPSAVPRNQPTDVTVTLAVKNPSGKRVRVDMIVASGHQQNQPPKVWRPHSARRVSVSLGPNETKLVRQQLTLFSCRDTRAVIALPSIERKTLSCQFL